MFEKPSITGEIWGLEKTAQFHFSSAVDWHYGENSKSILQKKIADAPDAIIRKVLTWHFIFSLNRIFEFKCVFSVFF